MEEKKFSFWDFTVEVLSNAVSPMTPQEIWDAGVKRGLDKKLATTGKTPWQTLAARLYVGAKKANLYGVVSIGDKPKRFLINKGKDLDVLPLFSSVTAAQSTASIKTKEKIDSHHSFTEAAQIVLEKFGGRKPLHYIKITEIALREGYVVSNSKHPEATMYAQIIQENQRKRKRGEEVRFFSTERDSSD